MVKIRLLDEVPNDDEEAFIIVERYKDGFVIVLVNADGDRISKPFILFLEPNAEGKLALSLAGFPNPDFVVQNPISNTILVNPSH